MSEHDYGYQPLPYQGEGEVFRVPTMPYATHATGEAALQYEPVDGGPSMPSWWPFGSGSTDWGFSGDGGGSDIESMWEWVSGMDEDATYRHAEAWRRAGALLASTAETLRVRAGALDAAWQSDGASGVFLEQVGATLYSLDQWATVAGNNAAGLTLIADAVSAAKSELEPLYDEYVATQAAEAREREKDRSGVLGRFDLGDLNDPFAGQEARSAEEVAREFHGRAVPIAKPVADAYVDAQFWWMDQGRRFAGPLDYSTGTGGGGPASGGGGTGSVPTVAGGPSALPPWAPSPSAQLAPMPGHIDGGQLAEFVPLRPAAPPQLGGPLPGAPVPTAPLPGAPVPLPPTLRPPLLPAPPPPRPPVLAPRPPSPSPRPPAVVPRPPVSQPPVLAPRPPAPRPPMPGPPVLAPRPPGSSPPPSLTPRPPVAGAQPPGLAPRLPGAGSPPPASAPRASASPPSVLAPRTPGSPPSVLAPRTPSPGLAARTPTAGAQPAPRLPGASGLSPRASGLSPRGPAAGPSDLAPRPTPPRADPGHKTGAPLLVDRRSGKRREDEDTTPPTGDQDTTLWTVAVPTGVVEAPAERPPAGQGPVLRPESRPE